MENQIPIENNTQPQNVDPANIPRKQKRNVAKFILSIIGLIIIIPIQIIVSFFISFFLVCGGEGSGCDGSFSIAVIILLVGIFIFCDVVLFKRINRKNVQNTNF